MILARALFLLSFLSLVLPAQAQAHGRDHEIHDPDTLAWWHTTEALSADSMEGRDTGTPAYERAAALVARRFEAAGLKPAGDAGTYFQRVPMHQIEVDAAGTSFVVHRPAAPEITLAFLHEITLTPSAQTPSVLSGALTFRGYCGAEAMQDIAGKVVLCFGTQRHGLPGAAERAANAQAGHAAAVVSIDDPGFTLEPPRWPYAYARAVTLRPVARAGVPQEEIAQQAMAEARRPSDHTALERIAAARGPQPVSMRLSAAAFTRLLEGTGHDATPLLQAGGAQQQLPSFDLPGFALEAHLHTTAKDMSSPNVLAVLPGTDPTLAAQYVVVSAHLDGYGFGTAVDGDNLYNGTLDDAAYVALLIRMAENLRDGRQRNAVESMGIGTGAYRGITMVPVKRSILFCAFTGEEKGLLGSTFFVQHPTVPLGQLAADINLDQLRPLFPLHILTALAVNDTTLGTTAREVGAVDGITVREDREPERGLLRRADHYPFLKAGVPAIGFIFGFDPGTDEERRYRHWYAVQYHRPQDDLNQPVDFSAAARFNVFFYRLVETVANQADRPHINPGVHF